MTAARVQHQPKGRDMDPMSQTWEVRSVTLVPESGVPVTAVFPPGRPAARLTVTAEARAEAREAIADDTGYRLASGAPEAIAEHGPHEMRWRLSHPDAALHRHLADADELAEAMRVTALLIDTDGGLWECEIPDWRDATAGPWQGRYWMEGMTPLVGDRGANAGLPVWTVRPAEGARS